MLWFGRAWIRCIVFLFRFTGLAGLEFLLYKY